MNRDDRGFMDSSSSSRHSNDIAATLNRGYSSDDEEQQGRSKSVRPTSLGWARAPEAKTKLDVLSARQIDRIFTCNMVAFVLISLYAVIAIALSNILWVKVRQVRKYDGTMLQLRAVRHDNFIGVLELVIVTLAFLSVLLVAILFTIRAARTASSWTHESVWVTMQLWTMCWFLLPAVVESILEVQDAFNPDLYAWIQNPIGSQLLKVASVFHPDPSYAIFYMLAMCHMFSISNRPKSKDENIRFYAFKAIPLVLYTFLRLTTSTLFEVSLSFSPFASFISVVQFSLIQGSWPVGIMICTSLMLVFESYFTFAVANRIRIAISALRRFNYLEFRINQVGFRVFLLNNVTAFVFIALLDVCVRFTVPVDIRVTLDVFKTSTMLSNRLGSAAVYALMAINAILTAHVSLPPDSVGLKGWFRASNKADNATVQEETEPEPLTISCKERTNFSEWAGTVTGGTSGAKKSLESNRRVDIKSCLSKLVMPTVISLFNFTWLAYEWESKKMKSSLSSCNFEFSIQESIKSEEKEAELLVISANDRIILAFKGATITSSIEKATTSLAGHLPTLGSVTRQLSRTVAWKRAHFSSSILEVYSSLSVRTLEIVQQLLEEQPRPILLTGHSYGGALATLCSLDLRMSLPIQELDLLVMTFGSPPCGNAAFRHMYNEMVPAHWGFEIELDLVTKLPRTLCHVGKRVVLTDAGELYLDPCVIEKMFWKKKKPNFQYHKRPAYYLALLAFCRKSLGHFKTEFWDFKVDESVVLTWENSCGATLRNDELYGTPSSASNSSFSISIH